MTFPRAALPFLLASTVLCTAGLGAPSGAINAVWNYPSNLGQEVRLRPAWNLSTQHDGVFGII